MDIDTKQFEEFLKFAVQSILSSPEDIDLKTSVDDRGVLMEISVPEAEMGKLIGKGGKTIKSIRTLLRAMGAKSEQRINLKIIEPVS